MRQLVILLFALAATLSAQAQYTAVFMGDSIFDSWDSPRHGGHPQFFASNNIYNAGKSGQVTAQMLARFEHDVVDKHPQTVLILAGTNDIAQNKGYVPNRQIMNNIKQMTRIAEKSGITVALCTILPADHYHWQPEIKPVAAITDMNRRIKRWARPRKRIFIDFYTPLATPEGALKPEYTKDGVHPNSRCYDVMETIVHKHILFGSSI